MAEYSPELVAEFKKKAEAVSIFVVECPDFIQAALYAINICQSKEACKLLPAGCEYSLSDPGASLCLRPFSKIIAAPGLAEQEFELLRQEAEKLNFSVVRDHLRTHAPGLALAVTRAEFALAESATCVIDSSSEDLRLATMFCEIHIVILPKSRLREGSYQAERDIAAFLSGPPGYLAFISGASRTSDIERVLTLGVHGPLEMHVVLLEE